MVTFPKQSFRLIILPCGFGPEKSELHLLSAAAGAAGAAAASTGAGAGTGGA